MVLLYSIFASGVMLAALVTTISIIRGGHTDSSDISSLMHSPEEQL
jgi:hypothetical protein